ncbi:MAG: glycosyltransferase [Clostridia bacterium]|nr:glycosyltransferase [Clostridia bacterium]
MSETPKISVIMSVYNGEDYLAETIDSILAQTFSDWELVVINDCSKDSTAEILATYATKDSRIKVHTNEGNLRLPKSLNKAISLSSGKYIARMDADDICLPNRLEVQYRFMEEHPEISLSSCRFFTLKNGVISSGGCGGRCDSDAIRAMLLIANPILHPGVIAKAEVFKEFLYDTTLTCTEDLELWTRMAYSGLKLAILPEYLLLYRLHDKQITATTLARQHEEVLKIQHTYYEKLLAPMENDLADFYIRGIYFKEACNIDSWLQFYAYIKQINKKTKAFLKKDLSYVMMESLAEYKRNGVGKAEIIKGLLNINPIFVLSELLRRKKDALRDGKACLKTANEQGFRQTGGTTVFPIFTKN